MSLLTASSASFVPSRFLKNQLFVIALGGSFTAIILVVWPRTWSWLLSANFLPHAYCYLRNPALVWTHVIADSLIAISYFAISVTLGYLGYKDAGIFLITGCFSHLDFSYWAVAEPIWWKA